MGALLGTIEASELYEYPGRNIIIKIKVAINVHNPISSGIHVGNLIDGTTLVDFRYEFLPLVCFNCGLLGHGEKLCQNQPLEHGNLAPLGPWIRSSQYGRHIMDPKENKFHSNPSKARNFGQYNPPVPKDMLQQLANMKLTTEDHTECTTRNLKRQFEESTKYTAASTTQEHLMTHIVVTFKNNIDGTFR